MSDRTIPIEVLDEALRGGEGCTTPEEIHRAVVAAMQVPGELARIEAHAASCAACGAELDLARAYEAEPNVDEADLDWVVEELRQRRGAVERSRDKVLPWRPRSTGARTAAPRRWALAAAVVLASGLGWLVASSPRAPRLGPPPAADSARGGSVELVTPLGELSTPPASIGWQPLAGAVSYRARLLGVDDSEIWSGTTEAASIALPETTRQRLETLVRYRVAVAAYDASGRLLGTSETGAFRIVEPAPSRQER